MSEELTIDALPVPQKQKGRADTSTVDEAKRRVLYKNARFCVTTADIRTLTTYYPINETVGKIRRDFLYMGLSLASTIGLAFWIYRDLWTELEMMVMGGGIGLALLVGTQVSALQLDARGFPPRLFVAHSSTVRKVFDAIVQARSLAATGGLGFEPDEPGGTE